MKPRREQALEPLLVNTAEAQRMLGCSHATLYALMKRRDAEGQLLLPTRKLGKLTMFETSALKAFVAGLPAAGPGRPVAPRRGRPDGGA